MHWDRLFEDLEGQLASEWEAARAALDAESERLRISRVELRSRLRALSAADAVVTVELPGGRLLTGRIAEVGADWVAVTETARHAPSLIPLAVIRGIRMDHGMLLASLDPAVAPSPVRERMTLGFLLRDLARRRVPVTVEGIDGDRRHGTIDRAGADHLDLALHEPHTPRRAQEVRGYVVMAFSSLSRIDPEPR